MKPFSKEAQQGKDADLKAFAAGEDPVEAIRRLTGQIGVDRLIDAVGVDAEPAEQGPAAPEFEAKREQFAQQVEQVGSAREWLGQGRTAAGLTPSILNLEALRGTTC